MKIEKLPSGSYRIRKMYKGKTHTIVLPYKPSAKELTIILAEKLQDASEPKAGTFKHYAEEYIADRSNVLSPSSIRTYNTKLGQLSEHFTSLHLYDISQADVQREMNLFSKNHSPKTTKTLHGFVASVLSAYRPELTLRTTLPVKEIKEEYEPSSEDIKRLLEYVKGTEYSIPFQLGVLSLRRGEICALTIDDLNGNQLHIHRNLVYNKEWILKETPKTEASNRIIVLPDSLAEEIRAKGYIYNNHPNALNKAIHRCQEALGIPSFKFHALRSYFASYAHALGIPDMDIMSMGGWKTDSVMKSVYRKSMEESRRESMKKISESILS